MLRDHYLAMARYNRWMNGRLYALSSRLTDEERKRDLAAFFKSVHGTLSHLLLTDRIWMERFTGDQRVGQLLDDAGNLILFRSLDQVLYEDFGKLRKARERMDEDIDRWASSLTDARLEAPFSYKNTSGKAFEHPLWWAASHFFNHQTHHRGQATALLMQLGHDPGVTDLVAFLRDH